MDWAQVLAICVVNAAIAIPLWIHLEMKMSNQAAMIENLMRDFHGRMISLEERYKAKMPH